MHVGVARASDHANLVSIVAILSQLVYNLFVGRNTNLLTGKVVLDPSNFSLVDVENEAGLISTELGVEKSVCEKHRIIVNISASEVSKPADVIKSAHQQSIVWLVFHLLSHSRLLIQGGLASELHVKYSHNAGWARWPLITPSSINEVDGARFDLNLRIIEELLTSCQR